MRLIPAFRNQTLGVRWRPAPGPVPLSTVVLLVLIEAINKQARRHMHEMQLKLRSTDFLSEASGKEDGGEVGSRW